MLASSVQTKKHVFCFSDSDLLLYSLEEMYQIPSHGRTWARKWAKDSKKNLLLWVLILLRREESSGPHHLSKDFSFLLPLYFNIECWREHFKVIKTMLSNMINAYNVVHLFSFKIMRFKNLPIRLNIPYNFLLLRKVLLYNK